MEPMFITLAIFSFREPSKRGHGTLNLNQQILLGHFCESSKSVLVQENLVLYLKCLTAEKGKRDAVMPSSSFLLLVTALAKVVSLGSQ